uniref:MANSC domain-containing protein n=1 Tax=Daphnia galeata TaxID=27404 RepID=A0A8J2RMM9_9CRUS|nr:unnamed protein product [Daphnia galeata]
MAPIILGLTVLFLGCFVQSGKTEAVVDVIHSLTHQIAPVNSVHWPAILGDDRSHRTGSTDGRLERSLFGSSSSTSTGSCLEQSEISENTIIRTKDSRALGAKFLNETSLGADARDRCLNLCCSFHGCNVAVYEEKDGGNCYLFDCGPADDFRCKFTSHSHYTSGVIRRRENAHEEELTQLKKVVVTEVTTTAQSVATVPMTNPPTTTTPPSTAKPVRTCSRYQFECHTTRECIAIYNACDGIIQCSDGSDEAPELGCPATTTETPTTRTLVTTQPVINAKNSPVDIQQNSVIAQHPPLDWRASRGRDRYSERDQVASVELPPNPDVNHWRTSQENTRNYERAHPPYQTGISGEAIPYSVEPDRSVNSYYNPDIRHYGSTWTERQERPINNVNDYRTAVDNTYYYEKDARPQYDVGSNVYPNRKHDWERNNAVIVNSSPPQLVYVKDSFVAVPVESRPIQPIAPIVMDNPRPVVVESVDQLVQKAPAIPEKKIVKTPELTTVAPVVVVETTTIAQPKITIPAKSKSLSLITKPEIIANHAHIHHFSVNQADFQEEKAERSRQTVGAAWALTLGLSVTAVLVLLVGCRLRSLKRHLRRGRGGHTRDADYLVNGMYL